MVKIQESNQLFWGIQLESGQKYSQKARKHGFQVTMAALENNQDSKDYVQVWLHWDDKEFLVCTLQHNASLQQPLLLVFGTDDEISFSINGKGSVHLTGHILEDDFDGMDGPDSDEESDEDIPMLVETGKSGKRKADLPIKKSKKLKLVDSEGNTDDDDDDDTDSEDDISEEDFSDDFGDSSFGNASSFLDAEAFGDSDDEDDDDYDEDEEDDSDEEDSDEEEESDVVEDSIVESPPKSTKKNKQEKKPNGKQEESFKTDNKTPKKENVKTPKKESKTPKQDQKNVKQETKTPKSDEKAKTPKQELEKKTPKQKASDLKTPNGKTPIQNGTATPGAEGDQGTEKKKKKKNKKKNAADNSLNESSAATPSKDTQTKATPAKATPAKATPAKATPAKATPKKSTVSGGTIIEDLKVGNGPEAKPGKMVGVYYKGVLQKNNKQFDSCQNGKPFRFRLGKSEVIKGWDNGLAGMKVGGKRKITVPASQGYGNRSNGPIPANSVLVFDVELKSVS